MLKIGVFGLTLFLAAGWLVLANADQSYLILKLAGAIIVSYGIFVAVMLATALHGRSHDFHERPQRLRSNFHGHRVE